MDFIMNAETPITSELLAELIAKHQEVVPNYLINMNLYKGAHAILEQEAKELGKPDYRLVVNFAKYIVDISEGFFIGIPVKVTHEKESVNDFVQDFRNRNHMADSESELSKLAAIYGHAYEYLYQTEDAESKVIYNGPTDMFLVCDDTIAANPLFAVRYFVVDDELHGELITREGIYNLSGTLEEPTLTDSTPHYYGEVPVIEYVQNAEKQSVFEPVKTLMEALNIALSEKMNDISYFAEAYLKVIGAEMDDQAKEDIRSLRLINLFGQDADKVIVEFMDKPNADQTQENMIDRLIDLIYQTAMVANMNDEAFAGTISGVAMEYKLQGMKSMALMKERKFQAAMQRRYKMLFNLPTNVPASEKDEWYNLRFQFTRNIPKNLELEAETMAKMAGVTSQETMFGVSSLIENPKEEIERIKEESPSVPDEFYDKDRA